VTNVIGIIKTKGLYTTTIYLISWCYMVKIQIDLDDDEDRIVEIYKLMNKFNTKQEAIKKMVRYFEAEVKPKNVKPKDYYEV